jgi:predicted transcriptional regulator
MSDKAHPWWATSGRRLGPLEYEIIKRVRSRGNATVRELLQDGNLQLAYTTVMTTLDRLYKKGLLERMAEGKAYRYSPRCAPEDVPRLVAVTGIQRWIQAADSSSLPHLSYFVEAISAHDASLLDELRVLVERKREELRQREKK